MDLDLPGVRVDRIFDDETVRIYILNGGEKKMKAKKKNFDYFEALAAMSVFAMKEAKLLKEIVRDYKPEEIEKLRDEMHVLEHQCDEVKHEMTTALVKEFLPPIDREDLFCLSHVTDNLTDCVESVVVFLYMADVRTLRDDTMEFVDLIIECCENVEKALLEFKNFKKSEELKKYLILLNDLEEKGDKLYEKAVRRLSQEAKTTREVIEWRDVYRNFERCFDAAESIADNIESAVMKNT